MYNCSSSSSPAAGGQQRLTQAHGSLELLQAWHDEIGTRIGVIEDRTAGNLPVRTFGPETPSDDSRSMIPARACDGLAGMYVIFLFLSFFVFSLLFFSSSFLSFYVSFIFPSRPLLLVFFSFFFLFLFLATFSFL